MLNSNIIQVTTKHVKCCGSEQPSDHPHIYLCLTKNNEKICPYCHVKYVYVDAESVSQ